jgi:hypothetical protein
MIVMIWSPFGLLGQLWQLSVSVVGSLLLFHDIRASVGGAGSFECIARIRVSPSVSAASKRWSRRRDDRTSAAAQRYSVANRHEPSDGYCPKFVTTCSAVDGPGRQSRSPRSFAWPPLGDGTGLIRIFDRGADP